MPAKLTVPMEIIKKEAVLADSYDTTSIYISLKGNKYVTVGYDIKDADGYVIGSAKADLDEAETAQFISDNPVFYQSIKKASYDAGKVKGVIPSDAGIV